MKSVLVLIFLLIMLPAVLVLHAARNNTERIVFKGTLHRSITSAEEAPLVPSVIFF